MAEVHIMRIVVASPGDVQAERNALPAVLEELNHGIAGDRGMRLELARWETDAYPGFHPEGPQGLIDPILRIEDCDVLIGIFWKRFGTPVNDAQSGTEHEFRRGYAAWQQTGRPHIMVYFNQQPYTPKSRAETDQWGQVLDFQRNFPKEGLWWPYTGEREFERLVRRHLTQVIRQHTTQPAHQPTPPVATTPARSRQPFEPEMILIPAGEFLMGSDPQKDKDARADEQPQHTLYLPDYYLAKAPVTNAQYEAFVTAPDHHEQGSWRSQGGLEGKEDHPVVGVAWYRAVAYCRWLSEVTGNAYSLPSEAEWEKAARGMDGRIYPWGDEWDPKRCNSREGGPLDTTSVQAHPDGASPYGILDMAGNVSEWTRSIWGKYPYNAKDGRERLERLDSFSRLTGLGPPSRRGGSFYGNRRDVRCAVRLKGSRGGRDWNIGFRVVTYP
jgi:formylglycine-generating enzyme required for sulfatase activity